MEAVEIFLEQKPEDNYILTTCPRPSDDCKVMCSWNYTKGWTHEMATNVTVFHYFIYLFLFMLYFTILSVMVPSLHIFTRMEAWEGYSSYRSYSLDKGLIEKISSLEPSHSES